MSKKVELISYEERVFNLLKEYHNGDVLKANEWLQTPNPQLGDVRPYDMMMLGRAHKLYDFIAMSLSETNHV